MDTVASRIKQCLEEQCLTQSELARRTGLSTTAVNLWMRGETKKLTPSSLLKVANVLKVNPLWLKTGKGKKEATAQFEGSQILAVALDEGEAVPPGYVAVPEYLIDMSAGNGNVVETENPDVIPSIYRLDWLRSIGLDPKYAKKYKVSGDSMLPILFDGDSILVDSSKRSIWQIKNGSTYIFRFGNELYVKRLSKQGDGSLTVISENSEIYKPFDISKTELADFQLLGRVLERSSTKGL